MTDKQKIENLRHRIDILTKENEHLKAKPETIRAINFENLVNDLKAAKKNYTDLSHAVLEQKVQYEELIHELKAAIMNYKKEINKCVNDIRG